MSQSSKTPLQKAQEIDPNAVVTQHVIDGEGERMLIRFAIKGDSSPWGNIYCNGTINSAGPYSVMLEIWNMQRN